MANVPSAASGLPSISFPATQLATSFQTVKHAVMRHDEVLITGHGVPSAVMLSIERYRELTDGRQPDLDALKAEFDEMVAAMQTPEQEAAMDAFFNATPQQLGEAALKAAQRAR